MWPWEHVALGYLLYSLSARAVTDEPPTKYAAFAVALGTLFPDLVDKPLAWWFSVLPSGRSLGHSLLFAGPIVLLAFAIAWWYRELDVGFGFAVGYGSHLVGDVVYPLVTEGEVDLGYLLWPLIPVAAGDERVYPHLLELFVEFLAFLATPRGAVYFLFDVVLVLVALLVWVADGAPGVRPVWAALAR